MKQFSITIPDNKESLFIELMKNLSFVENIEELEELNISEEHKNIVRERAKASELNPLRKKKWDDVKHNLKL